MTAEPILRGTFEQTPLEVMLGVLSLSRQPLAVRFSDNDREVGTVTVKAGRVVGAEDLRTRVSGADAMRRLASDPGSAFAVVELSRDAPEMQAATAIGRLSELLPEAGAGHRRKPSRAVSSDTEPPPAGEIIMRGEVSEFGFDEFLEALPLSRLPVLVTFTRGGSPVGTIRLMSGQVLAATAGSLQGVDAFHRLHADHGERFEVRRLTAPGATRSLGSIPKLLADGRGTRPPPRTSPRQESGSERTLFMEGRFSDFPLDVLIGSLAFCRQALELEFRRGEKILHRVLLKSGRITAAVSASAKGDGAALAAIREDPGSRFFVFRRGERTTGKPVAAVTALISETDATTSSVRLPAPPHVGPAGSRTASPPREAGADADHLSVIEAQLSRLCTDVAALRSALKALGRDSDRTRLADALSRMTAIEAKLRRGLERSHASVVKELRAALATPDRNRRERNLLWCILAAQLAILAAVVGLAILVM